MMEPYCLLATVDFPPLVAGGIQRYYYDLCREADGGISVLAPDGVGCAEFDGKQTFSVARIRIPLRSGVFARLLLTILIALYSARLLWRSGHRKLVVGHWFLLPPLMLLASLRGIEIAVIMHGGELNRFSARSVAKAIIVRFINGCDTVIVNSSYTENQFVEEGVDKSKIRIVTPAVDSARYRPGPYRTPKSLQGDSEFSGITLLTVATLVERKGHAAVISVIPRLLAGHGSGSIRYVIIGDGPCRSELTTRAEKLGIADSVHFLGRATDEEVIEWLHACDIFVMPSSKIAGKFGEEGFGIVYLEANACGKPVIGGDSGGVRDAVVDDMTGLLVQPGDSEALFNALDRLVRSRELRDKLGQQGRRRVVEDFQWRDRINVLIPDFAHHE